MKRLMIAALALCALPAHGADPTQIEIHTLTRIDALPTRDEIIRLTGPNAIPRLRELAMNQLVDFGVRLRAVRALPHFCIPTCKSNPDTQPPHPAHAALLDVLDDIPHERSGRDTLLLRATIESLGIARSGLESDVELLLPYLGDASRDVRATTARALGDLCTVGRERAVVALRARYQAESVTQVRLAIEESLRTLGQCTSP
jgi:HEAT repeat protein